MTAARLRDVVARAIDRFNEPARRQEYFELYDDAVVLHGYAPVPIVGRDAVRAFYGPLFTGFPDCRVTIEAMLVDGTVLACRCRFAGTHLGEFQGLTPTGRSFDVPAITMLRFRGDRCVERWSVTDFMSLMAQIGALPAPAA